MKASIWKRLLGFTALGAFALTATLWWQANTHQYEPIHITFTQLEKAEVDWRARWGRAPDERDREIILRNETNEEVLFREALRAGLHRTDPIVKRRLWQNMNFLELDEPAESGFEMLERAYEMEMHKSDIVVRRRLVQRFHRNLLDAARPDEPTREEVVAFIEEDSEPFYSIPRFSLVQIYFDGEFEDGPSAEALAFLEKVRSESVAPTDVGAIGDPLPVQREFFNATPVDLAKRFGESFTESIKGAPQGEWSGPYASALGWHVLWLHEYRPPDVVLDEATLAKARSKLIMRRKDDMVRNALAELRQRYEIIVGMPGSGNPRWEG